MIYRDKEIWIGALVLVLSAGMIGYIYSTDSAEMDRMTTSQDGSYIIVAHFNRSDGLVTRGEVRLAGVPVGWVASKTLNVNYQVRTILHIASSIRIPDDSAAVIQSDGLLGPKFVELIPGGSERVIPSGGIIRYTQDAILVDDLLERILARARWRVGGNNGK